MTLQEKKNKRKALQMQFEQEQTRLANILHEIKKLQEMQIDAMEWNDFARATEFSFKLAAKRQDIRDIQDYLHNLKVQFSEF